MKKYYSALLALMTLSIMSCSEDVKNEMDNLNNETEKVTETEKDAEKEEEKEEEKVVEGESALRQMIVAEEDTVAYTDMLYKQKLTTEETKVKGALQNLSLKMVKCMAANENGKNFVYSPYSMNILMSMIANGADGTSLNELCALLNIDKGEMLSLNSYVNKTKYTVESDTEYVKVEANNSLWIQNELPVKQNFLSCMRWFYNADVQAIDFSSQYAGSTINKWCERVSHGLIPELVDDGALRYKLFAANSLYFKESWVNAFKESKTTKQAFANADGSKSEVDMMRGDIICGYIKDKDFDAVTIPMLDADFSMTVFLPHEGVNVDAVVESMDIEAWLNAACYGDKMEMIDLKLPKFKHEKKTTFTDMFRSMGVNSIFNQDADFSRMITLPAYITEIGQKVSFSIDEAGCEGAAISYSGMETAVGGASGFNPTPFYVDRPFFFTVQQHKHGIMLFAGVMNRL